MAAHGRATTALLLAAGTGSRLQPLTTNAPKCLTEVGGIPILERLVHNLCENGIERLVIVIGHLGGQVRDFMRHKAGTLQVDYILSPEYRTTNNIYSLWLAREQIHEPFLLVESDLIFDSAMLEGLLQPDKIAVSRFRPEMNGTMVTVGPAGRVKAFHLGNDVLGGAEPRYKTVNIYSLSEPTWNKIVPKLDAYISKGRVGEYYEAVFADMVGAGMLSFDVTFFDPDRWYEIDTVADLSAAEQMISGAPGHDAVSDFWHLQTGQRGPSKSLAAND